MNKAEEIAKTLMEIIYVGAEMRYRRDQSKGEYDYDLRYTDGTIAAVEVTASMDHTGRKA
jgi:hypothetical protein